MKSKSGYKFIGLLIILVGLLVKALLKQFYPNPILIDLCRLSFFVGLAVLLIGLFQKKKA